MQRDLAETKRLKREREKSGLVAEMVSWIAAIVLLFLALKYLT